MTIVVFPSTLPQPSSIVSTPAERRLLSSETTGMPQVRNIQRDYVGFEDLVWQFDLASTATFTDFFNNTLLRGMRFFTASWQHVAGLAAVRRFTDEPTWKLIGTDYWEVTGRCEVRGTYGLTSSDVEPGGPRAYDVYLQYVSGGSAGEGTGKLAIFSNQRFFNVYNNESSAFMWVWVFGHNTDTNVQANMVSANVLATLTDNVTHAVTGPTTLTVGGIGQPPLLNAYTLPASLWADSSLVHFDVKIGGSTYATFDLTVTPDGTSFGTYAFFNGTLVYA